MANSALASDSLFQLNVLLWASFPQPSGTPITPVLRNAGYELWSIERPLNSNVAEQARLTKVSLQIQPNPVVDAVIYHPESNVYVLLECKPSSFSTDSGRSPQARGIIIAGGNIASRLGVPGKPAAEVCYLVPEDHTKAIDKTLLALVVEVLTQGFSACPTGPIGVSIEDDGAYLGSSDQPQGTAKIPQTLIPKQRVVAVQPGQDPKPLYLVSWIPDIQDSADLEDFKEKLRRQIICWLGKAPIGGDVTLSFNRLLNEVNHGIFEYWADMASLTGRVFPTIGSIVVTLFDNDSRVVVRKQEVRVNLTQDKDREELMERVRTAGLPAKPPSEVQLRLEEGGVSTEEP